MKRIVTALILIPIVAWVVLAAPRPVLLAVLAITGLLAYHEFDSIAASNGAGRAGWIGMAAGLALLLAPNFVDAVILVPLVGMALSLRAKDLKNSLATAAAFALGTIYIFGAWRSADGLHTVNPHWLMFALLLSWAGDTFALYVGKAFGRRKLAPVVSPSKTWEGAAGSLAGGLIAGGVYAHFLIPSVPLGIALALAAAGNVAGQVGDLCESAFKRGGGVKDSGTLLPGHGGWLDRIDSSLFTVPVIYFLLAYVPA